MTIQAVDAGYELARQRYADVGVDTDAALRRLVSAASRIRTGSWAAAWRRRGTIQGRRGRQTSSAPTRQRRSPSSPGRIVSTSTPSTASSADGRSSVTRSVPNISRRGSTGPRRCESGSTSTPRCSHIQRRPTTSRCRTATRASDRSGSATPRRAAGSARRLGRRSAQPA